MQRIPLGVADDDRLAVVRTRDGALVALDPTTGVVRWRQGRGLRPCAITSDAVVAVRMDALTRPAVVVLDAADGREVWSAEVPGSSGAIPAAPDDPTTFSLDCAVDGEQILLRWALRSGYGGGAAPSREILEEHDLKAGGVVRVDLRSRSLQPVTDTGADPPSAAERHTRSAAPDPVPALAADVVDHGRLGPLRVELATPAATGAVVLRGVDPSEDAVKWEVVLDEQAERRPPRLRP
ncbi:MAG: hypothetical protein JWP40_1200 [Blastococcus sp.]|jgi:hypothetical protein|nr:hypothetical protein [Blastococcus sp.]